MQFAIKTRIGCSIFRELRIDMRTSVVEKRDFRFAFNNIHYHLTQQFLLERSIIKTIILSSLKFPYWRGVGDR